MAVTLPRSAAAAALVSVALAGCGGGDPAPSRSVAPPSARVAVGPLPASLDPARASTPAARAIAVATQTPLLTYRRTDGPDAGELVPALARDLPRLTDDAREYRFSLRPGLLYADGRLVTASDVERAIAHASRSASDLDLRRTLSSIKGAPSADGQTLSGVRSDDVTGNVVVSLRQPDGRIPFALADPATAPLPELPRGANAEPTTSTGPLRVARRTGDVIELVANPLRPSIREVPAARFQRVTLIRRASQQDLPAVNLRTPPSPPSGTTRITAPDGPRWVLAVASRGILADTQARRAVFGRLDRRTLPGTLTPVSTAGATRIITAICGVVPPYVTGAVQRDPCPPLPTNTEATPLAGVRVTIAVAGGRAAAAMLGPVVAALRSAGATVTTRRRSDPAAAVGRGSADLALLRLDPSLPHPSFWLAPFASVDALLAREVPRLTRGPLTGTASQWSALDTRLVSRATAVPIGTDRATVDVGPTAASGSVLLHPVLGLDLAALAPR